VEANNQMKNVLVVGGGAREHALCDAVYRSRDVALFSIMKNVNPGIKLLAKKVEQVMETDVKKIVSYAEKHQIDMVFIGPEAPLESGLTDALRKKNISVCAPSKAAARIETDKEWMRNLLKKHNVSGQLQFQSFNSVEAAKNFIEKLEGNVVLKPVGLTGGKGVKVAGDHFDDINGAVEYIERIFSEKIGGKPKVVIEEKAEGEEFTIQAFTDGKTVKPFPAVQDHKRLLPEDKGPNTGGMGSYSCSNGLLPFLTQKEYDDAVTILKEIVNALAKENCPYIGPIYGQFMITASGPKVIEINARFGDPEAMNVLPLLQTDFIQLATAMCTGQLHTISLDVNLKSTVCKYVVPEGYGIKSVSGEKIRIEKDQLKKTGALLFYASVNQDIGGVTTTSSRSLAVVGISDSLNAAEEICEQALQHIDSNHIYIRHDIGKEYLILKRIKHMDQLRGMETTV
jgi:phosphoribosylamine---glycine ligase